MLLAQACLSAKASLLLAVAPGVRTGMPPSMSGVTEERNRTDAGLLQRMAQGDRDAFTQLYDRFSRPLYVTALRIIGDAREAEDIVHDAFLTLWEKAAAFSAERGTAFSWAVTLTRNRAIDRVRLRRRRGELLGQSAPADLGYGGASDSADCADSLVFKEKAGLVRAALADLPGEQRQAVELAFFGGLTQQEIAERLREPLGTVKARIRRGLLKLRTALSLSHD